MSVLLEERAAPADTGNDDHLICADCYPKYVPGRVVKSLCGVLTNDEPECTMTPCCEKGCGVACRLCLAQVELGGCAIHPDK